MHAQSSRLPKKRHRAQPNEKEGSAEERDHQVGARPCDSQALTRPEDTESAENHANRELERIPRDASKRTMHDRADRGIAYSLHIAAILKELGLDDSIAGHADEEIE